MISHSKELEELLETYALINLKRANCKARIRLTKADFLAEQDYQKKLLLKMRCGTLESYKENLDGIAKSLMKDIHTAVGLLPINTRNDVEKRIIEAKGYKKGERRKRDGQSTKSGNSDKASKPTDGD